MFTTARAGTNVTLNCTDLGAAGPGDTVSWAGDGQLGDTLPLIRVDQSHSGVYTCAVSRGSEVVLQTKAIRMFVITEKAPTRAFSWLKTGYYRFNI